MMTATVLVILMTIPGLALFYGGMVRTKNMLSVLMQVFATFSPAGGAVGDLRLQHRVHRGQRLLRRLRPAVPARRHDRTRLAATFSKGVYIPEYVYFVFQLTFAAITPCLIVGAFAERIKFSAVLLFMVLWFTFSYLPIAHMVWYWAGPDAVHRPGRGRRGHGDRRLPVPEGRARLRRRHGRAHQRRYRRPGRRLMLGKRIGYGKEAMPPHSLTMIMIGASLLWVGWFGFNVGSNLEATGLAAMVLVNTHARDGRAALVLDVRRVDLPRQADHARRASGAIAGLVAITPGLRLGRSDGRDRARR